MLLAQNNDGLRSLSQIFSTSNFNKVVREKDIRLTERRIKKYCPEDLLKDTYNKEDVDMKEAGEEFAKMTPRLNVKFIDNDSKLKA